MTNARRIFLLLVLALGLVAAGCGGDEDEGAPIPADRVQLLERRLTETENRLADGSLGACEDILNDTRPEVGRIVDSLPNDVDPDVRSALGQSFDRLWVIVEQECQDREPEETPEPAPEPEPLVPETDTETVPPETVPEEEHAPEEEDPEEAPLPPEGDGDNEGLIPGEGNGGGAGPSKVKKSKGKKE